MAKVPAIPSVVISQASTPTPPAVIPAWILGGGNFYGGQQSGVAPCPTGGCSFYDVDPGSDPDKHLFAGVIDASEATPSALPSHCPGIGSGGSNVSNCNPYKYVNILWPLCDTSISQSAFEYLDGSDPAGFLHEYDSHSVRFNLGFNSLCGSPMPSPTPAYPANPGNASYLSWLSTNAWTTANFPTPYGILEDNFGVSGYPCGVTYEYGSTNNGPCNMVGDATPSPSPTDTDWESALGLFAANTCGTTCFQFAANGLMPGNGLDTGSCNNIGSGQCWVTGSGGVISDADSIANVCANASSSGNLRAIEAEEVVFLKGSPEPSPVPSPTPSITPVYAKTQTIVYMLNTISQLVTHTSDGCKNMVAVDIEAGGGSFYPLLGYGPGSGSPSAGIPVRLEATAMRFLVPDPVTLVPDRIVPFYYTIGGTNNHWAPSDSGTSSCNSSPYCEVPYFFEETLVPQGPDVSVGAFSWNGSTQSVGDGCPSNPGDSGGAVDLVATCVGIDGSAVFRQVYDHLYIDGEDYGPAAVLLNTSPVTSVPIVSSWFSCTGCHGISAFNYKLALSGGELQSVNYPGRLVPISLPCTQTTYCNGDNSVPGNTSPFSSGSPGGIGPHSGMILLASH